MKIELKELGRNYFIRSIRSAERVLVKYQLIDNDNRILLEKEDAASYADTEASMMFIGKRMIDEHLGVEAFPIADKDFDFDEYQKQSLQFLNKLTDSEEKILTNVALGLTGESGEFADIIKKIYYHQHPFSIELRTKLLKELGDILWYIARGAETLGSSLKMVAELNIEKLTDRHGQKFNSEFSQNKDESKEAIKMQLGDKLIDVQPYVYTHIRKRSSFVSQKEANLSRIGGLLRAFYENYNGFQAVDERSNFVYFVSYGGGVLCHNCANHRIEEAKTLRELPSSVIVNYQFVSVCESCGNEIFSVYDKPEDLPKVSDTFNLQVELYFGLRATDDFRTVHFQNIVVPNGKTALASFDEVSFDSASYFENNSSDALEVPDSVMLAPGNEERIVNAINEMLRTVREVIPSAGL